MPSIRGPVFRFFALLFLLIAASPLFAQSGSNSGTVVGTVTDGSGAVVVGAKVTIKNAISGYERSTVTDQTGKYTFSNLPFNPYHVQISAPGFDAYHHDVDVHSPVAINVTDALKIGGTATTVTVDSGDLLENDSTVHTDVDRGLMEKMPLESQSSGLSSLVTETSPGVASDSNGQMHGLGDHASNTFSIDGQDISDQQSKVFSNQLPSNSVQSIEVISGAPPAEFGGKTSLIIQVTTRSGQGATTPTGSITSSYGSFGAATGGIDLSYGGKKWGQLHRSRWTGHGTVSGSAGVQGLSRQGQRGKCLRPRRPELYGEGFDPSECELQPVLVPDAEHLRQSQRAECVERWCDCDAGDWQRRRRGSAVADWDLQHRADVHACAGQQCRLQLRPLWPAGCLQLLSQRKPAGGSRAGQSADVFDSAVPDADQRRRAFGYLLREGHT